ncbi:MFS transporter [Brevibacterium sp. VCM10]|uniref:MFS transporter n=1 Tax=Brevibacterium sp. VCM10 TaxID=1381751 RepID=UPI00046E5834|nr:MFS transporter [Brevibacterium sp. VCM10]
MSTTHAPLTTEASTKSQQRKVAAGTLIGTTIEWYDFFIYAQAAGLIFADLYFKPLGAESSALAQIVSWASLGISFLFRPLGAAVAGHLGDRLGRKTMLVLSLILMGGATALIGLLPTYATWGVWAPLLLVFLRVLQGFSAGGEWGGAALMAVEHAPAQRRGFFGAYPQIGTPLGMVLATAVMFVTTTVLSHEAFLAWGWRIPFLLSVVLVAVGFFIRRSVEESPMFRRMQERKNDSHAPMTVLLRHHLWQVIRASLIFVANNAAGYLLIAFFVSYGTKHLGMEQAPLLLISTVAAVFWLAFTMTGGIVSDRIGRVRTYQIGYAVLLLWSVPMCLLIETRSLLWFAVALILLSLALGLSFGPQAALFAEMFPTSIRYSGVSLGYAIGAVVGGAFAPMIAEMLVAETGSSVAIGAYITALCLTSLIVVSTVREPRGIDLDKAGA